MVALNARAFDGYLMTALAARESMAGMSTINSH